MSVGSVVVLALLALVVAGAAALMVRMFVKDEPLYGAIGLGLLTAPGAVLSLAYLSVA
ncbi:hypothetical protein LZG04_30365 [Saccharothrix sp. S26]|uniref:hypothetical protein n=1 Tax=Saccharothrix sp. S26 TaxID=2907215 RepID=UPI001F456386|nr:hypothetical protein [Saccharothrix sp. S26]MCE6999076.1 hypothetical protein [Saccharothrix sp. S26]